MYETPLFVMLSAVLAWLITFVPRAVMQGVPLMLGSTGETLTEKSGNLNLGIPGIMYVGGISGVIGGFLYDKSLQERATEIVNTMLEDSGGRLRGAKKMTEINWVYSELQSDFLSIAIPVVCCLLGALLMGLIYSFLTVTLRANQNVTGLALTTFGIGVGNFFGGSLAKLAGGGSANIDLGKLSRVFKSPVLPGELPEWLSDRVRLILLIVLAALFAAAFGTMTALKVRRAETPRWLRRLTALTGILLVGFASLITVAFDEHQRLWAFAVTAVALIALALAWIIMKLARVRVPAWVRWLTMGFGVFGVALMGVSYGFMVYVAIAIALVASHVLSHTRTGLHLRAVGENPATADAAGISVNRYKYVATCVGAMIAGLGGLYYVMDYVSGVWSNNAFGDRGWLAVALVIFTVWRPGVGVPASILFGGMYILNMYIPTGDEQLHLKELYKMIPYVVTLLVLIATSIVNRRDTQPPAHLGLPYFREER